MSTTAFPAPTPRVYDPAERLHVCMPAYGCMVSVAATTGLLAANDQALAQFSDPAGGPARPACIIGALDLFGNESHIDRARNRLVDRLLSGNLKRLIFIDADIDFTPADLARVWLQSIAHPKAIICGPYATKSVVPQFAINPMAGETPDPQTSLVKVRHAGTGFMVIPRQLFHDLIAAEDAPAYQTGGNESVPFATMRAFFQSGVKTMPDGITAWLSEDYNICERAAALGYPTLVDRGIELGHWGMIKFPIPPKEIFEAARRYRAINHPDCPPEKV